MMRRLVALATLFSLGELARAACAVVWEQCGGLEFTGEECCETGSTCIKINDYYWQCQPNSMLTTLATVTGAGATTTAPTTTRTGPVTYTTTDTEVVASHTQVPYPEEGASGCGAWSLVDNVCCPSYCQDDLLSESCRDGCTCVTPPSDDCMSSDEYPELHEVTNDEPWHYSRSTHFGLTSGGACGFGLYSLCTKGSSTASWTDPMLGSTCDAFCTAYPTLCKDPSDMTWRGNFMAPNGNYYTQFWASLPGDRDNYLSCGECFELIRTRSDGSEYEVGESGYTPPIIGMVADSCPCSANPKWCCGPGADHCAEIDFKYGCPIPDDSIHLDLSDIAMGRLQGNGSMNDGVIPIRYRRTPCPSIGNAYAWLREGGGPYYFALSIVNTAGSGSVTKVEIKDADSSEWVLLDHDPNYTSSRPQERYGAWVMPRGYGPFNLPIGLRLTSPNGEQIVNEEAIKSFTPPADAPTGFYYLDLGVQFTV